MPSKNKSSSKSKADSTKTKMAITSDSSHSTNSKNSKAASRPLHHKQQQQNADRRVSFGTVVIREHRLCLGNNPACSSGPPTAIEWKPQRSLKLSVDEYESHTSSIERRSRDELVMPRRVREEMLRRRGYSRREIFTVTQENARLQQERMKSMEKYARRKKVEDRVQGALSIFRRSNSVNSGSRIS